MLKSYIQKNGVLLPAFMAAMAGISLSILSSNMPAFVAPGEEIVQDLFIVWGVIMAVGSILVLFGQRVGVHVFVIGAFAER